MDCGLLSESHQNVSIVKSCYAASVLTFRQFQDNTFFAAKRLYVFPAGDSGEIDTNCISRGRQCRLSYIQHLRANISYHFTSTQAQAKTAL